MMTKKKRSGKPTQATATINLPRHINEEGVTPEDEQRERELKQFYNEQKLFEEKKR